MKIFVSWSGERSKAVARALREWLGDVFYDTNLWMSEHDIHAGARWGAELNVGLESANFGILCLTPENLNSPWILFEAGSLAKAVKTARVVPYLLDLSPTEVQFPLAQFQGVVADQVGTFTLIESINSVQNTPLQEDRLHRIFVHWWPELEAKLSSIPPPGTATPPLRTERDLLEEVLELMRKQQKSPSLPAIVEGDPNAEWPWGKLPPPVQVDEFHLVNVKSGGLLQAGDAEARNGAPLEVVRYTGDESQLWSLHQVQRGYFVVRSAYTGQCIDVEGSDLASGTRVHQWEHHGGDNQKWALIPQRDGSHRLRCKHSARYLSFHSDYVAQMDEIDTSAQRWWLISVVR
jgi:hypothetical protein